MPLVLLCPNCKHTLHFTHTLVDPEQKPRREYPVHPITEETSSRAHLHGERRVLLDMLYEVEKVLEPGIKNPTPTGHVDEAAYHRNRATRKLLIELLEGMEALTPEGTVCPSPTGGTEAQAGDAAAGPPPVPDLHTDNSPAPSAGTDNSRLEGSQRQDGQLPQPLQLPRKKKSPSAGDVAEAVAGVVDAVAGTSLTTAVKGLRKLALKDERGHRRPSPEFSKNALWESLHAVLVGRWEEGRAFATLTFPGGDRRTTTHPDVALHTMVKAWDAANRHLRKEHDYNYIRIVAKHNDGHYHLHLMLFGVSVGTRNFFFRLRESWEKHSGLGYVQVVHEDEHQTPEGLTNYLMRNMELAKTGRRAFSTSQGFYGDAAQTRAFAEKVENYLHTRR